MNSRATTAQIGPPERVPIFSIPERSLLAVEALRVTGLDRFYELNRNEFTMLVSVVYVGFLQQTEQLRKGKPAPRKLYDILFSNIKMFLTVASPQWESLQLEKPGKSNRVEVNGLASEFLWSHLKREGLLAWQDFYADDKRKNPKVEGLVDDFVHFVIAKGFEEDAATFYISDESKLQQARRVIQAINRGDRSLKSL